MAAILPPATLATLTEAQNGTTVVVASGGELDVRLAANPSTGYSWQMVRGPPAVAITRRAYRPDEPDGPTLRVGAPGEQVFSLRVLAPPGEVIPVELAYKPPGRTMAFGRVWRARLRVVEPAVGASQRSPRR